MNKKTGLQVVLVLVIVIISLWFYLKYFTKNFEDVKETPVIEKIDENQNNTSTYIDDINYVSTDLRGNEYQITAKLAEIKVENPDLMFLTDVIAFIFIKDKDAVKITSNFGKYNSKNYDTIFSKNVVVTYPNHKILGEYLDFSYVDSIGIFSTNIIYVGNKTKMFADKIEIDLTTNNTKIFMIDNSKKVLIEGVN